MSTQKRGKSKFHLDTKNPELAWQNHYQRDLQIADYLQKHAKQAGLRTIINDGKSSIEAILAQVEMHFQKMLSPSK